MIIDFHTVIHPYEMRGIRLEPDEFIERLDLYGIEKAAISAPFYLLSDYILGNELVKKWVKEHPSRLLGFANINPYFESEAVSELKRCRDWGFKGLGEYHSDLMDMPYDNYHSLKIIEEAVKLDMPVLFHTGEKCLATAKKVVEIFPEGKFVFAHIGNTKWRELLPFARGHQNLYLCTSGTMYERGFVEEAVKYAGEHRVIYGSDFIFIDPAICIGMIKAASISDSAKRKVLYENAAGLLRLEE